MKKLYKIRLLRLARHLERGKLGHKRFDMFTWNSSPHRKDGCGTSGCAIGECPIVFPNHWKFVGRYCVLRSEDNSDNKRTTFLSFSGVSDIEKFFGMGERDVRALFIPARRYSRKQQAERIREFVYAKEN